MCLLLQNEREKLLNEISETGLLMIQLTINGEVRQLPHPINIEQLIDQNNLQGKRIAIERNGEIVPRSQYAEQYLADGDHLEVVIAVGGG